MSYQYRADEFGPRIETKSADDEIAPNLVEKIGELSATVAERLKEIDALKETEKKSATRFDRIEARMSRPAIVETKAEDAPEYRAFEAYLRSGQTGVAGMDPIERKSLSVGTLSAGGYLAPEQVTMDFVRDLTLFSPIRAIATVKQTNSHTVLRPKRTGITNAVWQGEAVATTGSQPAFGQLSIEVKTLATHTDINNMLIEDAATDVVAEVNMALAEDFGAKEGKAFVSGDGVLEPEGFMTATGVAEVLNGHAANLSPDALISILYSLDAPYRSRATWVMNGNVLATIRKLKDSQGNYLWQPGLQAGQPETILGRPVVEAIDMPDIGANAFPIALGDFATAYCIYDRKQMDVKLNPYLLMTTDQTRVHAWRRTGAAVVQPKALRKLKMATS